MAFLRVFAVIVVAFATLVCSPVAFADNVQTFTRQEGDLTVTEESSTRERHDTDGSTTSIYQHSAIYRDKSGKIVREVSRESTRTVTKDGFATYVKIVDTDKTYAADGSYRVETTDTTGKYAPNRRQTTTVKTTEGYDAKGALQVGDRKTTYSVTPGDPKTTKANVTESSETWDAIDKRWRKAGQLGTIPTSVQTQDLLAVQINPTAGMDGGIGDGSKVALPPYAGPSSQIVLNVQANQEENGGPSGVLMLTINQQGHKQFFRVTPKAVGEIVVAADLGHEALKSISLLRGIGQDGQPQIASTCEVGSPTHIPGTDAVSNPPSNGPAITEVASSGQPGDFINVHIARDDPTTTQFWLDNQRIQPLGVSDNSATLRLPVGEPLGKHKLSLESAGQRGNSLTIEVVKVWADPVPPSEPGIVQTVTVHVDGLAPSDTGEMDFEVGGAATMVDGGTTATAPVSNGVAHVQIRGIHAGQALLRFHLRVKNPDFV